MGCDIHCYAEVKKDGKWEKVGKIFKNAYYNPKNESKVDSDGYEWNAKFTDSPYDGRNYNLFAILADVRNGRGFAGIPTGSGFNPISEPKGLPHDVSVEIATKSNEWGGDGHSHNWFTLKELQEYDYNQLTVEYGVVDPQNYKLFKKDGQPKNWCGDVSGGGVKIVTNRQMEKLIKDNSFDKSMSYYTRVEWGNTYRSAVGDYFFDKTLPALRKLGDAENVRIVFWFDN